jgi:hypothetical protein
MSKQTPYRCSCALPLVNNHFIHIEMESKLICPRHGLPDFVIAQWNFAIWVIMVIH